MAGAPFGPPVGLHLLKPVGRFLVIHSRERRQSRPFAVLIHTVLEIHIRPGGLFDAANLRCSLQRTLGGFRVRLLDQLR